MECHPVCDLFPEMAKEEFAALCEDIAKRGQLVPIWTHDGRIIDGRHRWRACTLLGKAPKFQEWDGTGSLVEFVVSLNLHRRHLDTSQRGMLATRIMDALKEEGERRMADGGRKGRESQKRPLANLPEADLEPETVCEADPPEEWTAREQAARMVNVSPRLVQDAAKVRAESPDLAEAVARGETTVHAALKAIKGDAPASPRKPTTPRPADRNGGEWVWLPDDVLKSVDVLRVHFGKHWVTFTAAVERAIDAA